MTHTKPSREEVGHMNCNHVGTYNLPAGKTDLCEKCDMTFVVGHDN